MSCSEREWEVGGITGGGKEASRVHQLTGRDVILNVMLGVVFQPPKEARAEKGPFFSFFLPPSWSFLQLFYLLIFPGARVSEGQVRNLLSE